MTKRVIYDTSKPLSPEERADAIDGAAELIGDDDFEFVDHAVDPRADYAPADLFNALCKWSDDNVTAAEAIALYMELHPDADREAVTAEVEAFAAKMS